MRKISRVRKLLRALGCLVALGAVILAVFALLPPPKGMPVFEYHMVGHYTDADERALSVTPEELDEQLSYLQEEGYTTVSMLEFMKARKGKAELPEKPVILTFDDGYEDNYLTMLPILEKHGMKATVYVVTNFIGKRGYLSWDELHDMEDRGIEIGSHTANHRPLTTLPMDEVQDELKLSKLLLEWNGLRTVFTLSYPNGAYDEEIRNAVAEDEYLTAVTGDSGLNTFATDPYEMQRINVSHDRFGLTEFKLRLFKAEVLTRLGLFQHREK